MEQAVEEGSADLIRRGRQAIFPDDAYRSFQPISSLGQPVSQVYCQFGGVGKMCVARETLGVGVSVGADNRQFADFLVQTTGDGPGARVSRKQSVFTKYFP